MSVSHGTTSDQATTALKADIIRGLLEPGTEVSEMRIAERYGIGRAGARAALQRLAGVGLVRPLPRRGYLISDITIRDVRNVLEMRLVLEPLAARLAAGRVDVGFLRRTEERAVRLFDEVGAFDPGIIRCNREIHLHIAGVSGNERLARTLEQLLDDTERVLVIGLARGPDVPKMIGEHSRLIDALGRGDAEVAEHVARQHMETTWRNVMDALTGSDRILEQRIGSRDDA